MGVFACSGGVRADDVGRSVSPDIIAVIGLLFVCVVIKVMAARGVSCWWYRWWMWGRVGALVLCCGYSETLFLLSAVRHERTDIKHDGEEHKQDGDCLEN